ncbi:alpha/beta hydrolase [Rhodococcus sp. ABRD24]|uniref:alpha/beta hydrolase n=1 Tax=Rhodococcus sp. ABRD24 TaxID=2507582 RepID=UPI0013F160A0|nr:alpha/beta hydrolase [Rhodococcus sp. ABRD24]
MLATADPDATPYPWVLDAHDAMGGRLLTIECSVHGSTVGSSCGGLVTEFLASGRLAQDVCAPQ